MKREHRRVKKKSGKCVRELEEGGKNRVVQEGKLEGGGKRKRK